MCQKWQPKFWDKQNLYKVVMDISRVNLIFILLKLSEIEMIKLTVTKRVKLNNLPLPMISFEIIKRSLKKVDHNLIYKKIYFLAPN